MRRMREQFVTAREAPPPACSRELFGLGRYAGRQWLVGKKDERHTLFSRFYTYPTFSNRQIVHIWVAFPVVRACREKSVLLNCRLCFDSSSIWGTDRVGVSRL